MLPLKLLNKYQTLILAYKIHNKLLKCNINITLRKDQHNYETRIRHNYDIQKSSNDFFSQGLILFNELKSNVKNLKSLNEFKLAIKKQLALEI